MENILSRFDLGIAGYIRTPIQREMHTRMMTGQRELLYPPQSGKTTALAMYIAAYMHIHPGANVHVVSSTPGSFLALVAQLAEGLNTVHP